MLQDYKLGVRMLLKHPGLTIAGGLALAIAIGIGAGWYDLWGKLLCGLRPSKSRLALVRHFEPASRHRRSARVSSRPSTAGSSPDAASMAATSVPQPER